MANRTKKPKGLSMDKGRFVKSVGYVLTKGGTVQPRRWYLGTDSKRAYEHAEKIKRAWDDGHGVEEITVDGEKRSVWVDGADPLSELASVELVGNGIPSSSTNGVHSTNSTTNHPTDTTADGLTVEAAGKMYLANIEARYRAGQVSHAYWAGESHNLKRGLALLGLSKPLAKIGSAELTAAVLVLAGRPLSTPTKGQKTAPKKISVKSAKIYIAALKAFLVEMSKTEVHPGSELPLWRKPLRFEEIFRNNQPLLTADERQQLLDGGEAEAIAFTVDEVRTLYSGSSDRQRLWILLGLNCGFSSMELATLTVGQIHGLDTDAPKIRRFRGKTDVYAEWHLWKETADLLRKFLAKDRRTQPGEVALLTDDRQILIEPRGMGRRDAVRSAWVNTVAVLPEDRRLTFKYVRKTGARMIRLMPDGVGGDAVAEMYLSHADDKHGVLKAYSGRAWDKLSVALVELRRQLFAGWEMPIRKIPMGKGKGKYVQLMADTPIGV